MSSQSAILLEIGNSTIKLARRDDDGAFHLERFDTLDAFRGGLAALDAPILCAPVGEHHSRMVLESLSGRNDVRVITREDFAGFLAGSYDTPGTLGLDRILNLLGLEGDGIAISCGTAITVDALAGGRPLWGAIMPGFRIAAEGLHERIPALPLASLGSAAELPARNSLASVTNGVLLGTALGAQGIARELAARAFKGASPRIILTGGDAALMASLWRETSVPEIDEALLFRGMMRADSVELRA